MSEPLTRADLEAALAAREELGPQYDKHVLDAFLQKLDGHIDERLRERGPTRPARGLDLRLPLGSLGIGVGATAVAGSDIHGVGGIVVAIVAWLAIAAVNVAYAFAHLARSWRR